MKRKGNRYLLESNLVHGSNHDNWSGEMNTENWESLSELILAARDAEAEAMKSHIL